MKTRFAFLFTFFVFCASAQSNLTVFNNDGRQFYVIMNGIKQNAVPQTNVFISSREHQIILYVFISQYTTAKMGRNLRLA